MGSPQQKPKLVRLLCDVSGSMYRFNGYDGRMERELEAMLMVMESFEKYEEKIKVSLTPQRESQTERSSIIESIKAMTTYSACTGNSHYTYIFVIR